MNTNISGEIFTNFGLVIKTANYLAPANTEWVQAMASVTAEQLANHKSSREGFNL